MLDGEHVHGRIRSRSRCRLGIEAMANQRNPIMSPRWSPGRDAGATHRRSQRVRQRSRMTDTPAESRRLRRGRSAWRAPRTPCRRGTGSRRVRSPMCGPMTPRSNCWPWLLVNSVRKVAAVTSMAPRTSPAASWCR